MPGKRKQPNRSSTPESGDGLARIDRFAVAVDLVVFTIRSHALHVLLVRRAIAPYRHAWALPGGFVRDGESLEATARRELSEETGVSDIYLEQLFTFGAPGRDPRGRVISVAYVALVAPDAHVLAATTDAEDAAWHRVAGLPRLAFDHASIVAYALERLRNKLVYTGIGFALLPAAFTLTELQRVHEIILGAPVDKRNFRKKVLAMGIVEPTGERRMDGTHRPARTYRFCGTIP